MANQPFLNRESIDAQIRSAELAQRALQCIGVIAAGCIVLFGRHAAINTIEHGRVTKTEAVVAGLGSVTTILGINIDNSLDSYQLDMYEKRDEIDGDPLGSSAI